MSLLLTLFAASLAFVAVAAFTRLIWGYLNIPRLCDIPPLARTQRAPRVSIVVAARDEERNVEAGVRSLLRQEYPDFELVVVDDRSSDRTPEILARIAADDSRLRIARVDALPDGWLGKNHALHHGARHATGELILFADGDVILDPDALSRGVRMLQTERADHLAVAPDLHLPSWPLALVVNYFMLWFLLWLQPWKARDPRSGAHIGIGAYNLMSLAAYRAVGGHTRIALRPDDDLMLGKVLKDAGYTQVVAAGTGLVSVEWYQTVGELARGFRKNAFAGLRYSIALTGLAVVGNLVLGVVPFVAVWLTSGLPQFLFALTAVALVAAYSGPALIHRTRPWLAVLYPLAALLFVAIIGAAVGRTLLRRSIEWRGTRYSLDELRANRV